MLKVFHHIFTTISFIVPFALLLEAEGLPGEEKKEAVLIKLKQKLDELEIKFPDWLDNLLDPLLGLLIDVVVYILNKLGFFEHGGESSET